ncbi:hypothetical protein BHE74_00003516 [Ensete ventricosum]|nr:hypothetical protein BHE74_00003516 [Ensete ventricosum]
MVRVTGELDWFSAHIRLREPDKSEDKIETAKRTQWFESGGRKGRGSDDKSSGAQLPKNQSCDGTVEAGLPWSIDPLLSWRESIDRKRGREGGECRGKLQVPRQDERVEAKELYKTSVDGLLIEKAESEGLRIDAGVLD